MITFALHGGYLSAGDLCRDMGNPVWVDHYLSGHDPEKLWDDITFLAKDEPVALIGYSSGGDVIGDLSWMLSNIVCAVLYESPLIGIDQVIGNFPVLWIRNNYKSTRRREREFDDTLREWSVEHPVTKLTGKGRHIYWRKGWPPFGHAWDKDLNDKIRSFIVSNS